MEKNSKVIAIGGGTGLPIVLKGLKDYTENITAIVSVIDSGGSTGRLREEFNIIALGDMRRCILALSNTSSFTQQIFEHRFSSNGFLNGHNLGNLVMLASTQLKKSDKEGLQEIQKQLNVQGKVLPVTLEKCNICAELEDGTFVLEEENIDIPKYNPRPKIKRVFLDRKAELFHECKQAIKKADFIILGPGDLYTSIVPNLLVKGMKEEIKNSKSKKILICNLMTKNGETNNFKASDFVKEINKYLDCNIDYVILNKEIPNDDILNKYKNENVELVKNDYLELNKLNVKIFLENLLDNKTLKEKQILRHDSKKLGSVLINLR